MGVFHTDTAGPQVDSGRAVHHAVMTAAIFSALVGQFCHHFPEADVPEALAAADGAAFEDATMLLGLAGRDSAGYDLSTITRTAFESGKAHADGECPFCESDEPELLAVEAVAHGRALAAAALA